MRRDTYNTKLFKYLVEVDDDDEEVHEDLEKVVKTQVKAISLFFHHVGF